MLSSLNNLARKVHGKLIKKVNIKVRLWNEQQFLKILGHKKIIIFEKRRYQVQENTVTAQENHVVNSSLTKTIIRLIT